MDRYLQYMYSYPHKTAYRPLQNVSFRDYFFNLEGEGHSLYLHLPFCESKCGYCNLFSVTGCTERHIGEYLDACARQIGQYREIMPESTRFGDFTIGGGTPLLLDCAQIARIFETVRRSMPLSGGIQMIIETAPNQTCREKMELLKALGITRVSMGIQSFNDAELRWMGRRHDSGSAKGAAALLADMRFDCINFDFIYGIPGQTGKSLLLSLKTALTYAPDEIFLYPLYIKHGVKLERENRQHDLNPDAMFALYQCGSAFLRENGYEQLSMRRFVKKGTGTAPVSFCECGLKSALSIGCGGRSYLGRLHACTPYKTTRAAAMEEIRAYQETEDFLSVKNGILLSEDEMKRRYVIKHLLMLPGISKEAYRRAYRSELAKDFPLISQWLTRGWLREDDDLIGLTEEGLGLSDSIGPQLISESVMEKMLEWERANAQENHYLPGVSEKL